MHLNSDINLDGRGIYGDKFEGSKLTEKFDGTNNTKRDKCLLQILELFLVVVGASMRITRTVGVSMGIARTSRKSCYYHF